MTDGDIALFFWRIFSAYAIFMSISSANAALYTGIAPVLNGDVHQARREALRTILLEAGQSGQVLIATQSTLVNMELSEAVRLQSNAVLQRFKVVQEIQEGNLLTLTADVELKDQLSNTPIAPIQLRNLLIS